MVDNPVIVQIFLLDNASGAIEVEDGNTRSAIWSRIKLSLRSKSISYTDNGSRIELSWPDVLGVVRELGSKTNQISLGFRFKPNENAAIALKKFAEQFVSTRKQRKELSASMSTSQIETRLAEAGFTKRSLKEFQLRDLQHLLSLENGANFSVPGAGKTTVTFALHTLTRQTDSHLIIVAPKAANQAWIDVVEDCMKDDAPNNGAEPFTLLNGREDQTRRQLTSGATRFIVSYDLIIRQQGIISAHIATHPTHLVLDESHRMKAGFMSQRGSFLLNVSPLPVRRDILSGTPMPQGASDIESQLDFLWPGHGLGLEVVNGSSPRDVLGNLYVRTTKEELELPKVHRDFVDVSMSDGQLALYSIVKNEFVQNYSKNHNQGLIGSELRKARRSVMRLLQLSVNPMLALTAMANEDFPVDSAVVDQVMDEGHSNKMGAVMDHARQLASEGKKCVIWSIFTDTIRGLVSGLADLNPVFIHGGVPSGLSSDPDSREGKIRRFHQDDGCFVLVANPAAAGEGISLHTVCNNAIYADRSYVSTHYLQSIDRIHRLGLPPDQETNIYIYRSKAPPVVGSIDLSVSRRLAEKIRNMQRLLDDPDLHRLAIDEEGADDPIDYDVDLQDIIDLISELRGRAEDGEAAEEV